MTMNQGGYGGSGEYYPNVNTDIGGGYYDDGEYYVDDGVVVDENGVAYYYDEQGDQHYATNSADFQYDASYYDNNAATDEIESEGFVILGRRCNYQPPLVIHAADHCGMDDDNPASGGIIKGDPISAIATASLLHSSADNNEEQRQGQKLKNLMYVASHTTSGSNAGAIAGGKKKNIQSHNERGSRMTLLYDINNNNSHEDDTSTSIYSSYVAHPEAESTTLDALHTVLFGAFHIDTASATSNTINNNVRQQQQQQYNSKRPSHAYGPAYGPASYVHKCINSNNKFNTLVSQRPEEKYCAGIHSIFEVSTPTITTGRSDGGGGGRVCTISPYGVRVHARGGMVILSSSSSSGNTSSSARHNSKSTTLAGMTCGMLMPGGGEGRFAVIGGMSTSTTTTTSASSSSSSSHYHVHCVDLHRDMKIVSSHSLMSSSAAAASSGAASSVLCVSDMAVNNERNHVVVGCTDGTIRVLDSHRKNVEIAKTKSHIGGVSCIAVSDNLIAATGYSSPPSTSVSTTTTMTSLSYPYPASHVLLYDVRALGRGGIPHVSLSAGGRGGPRYVNFLPNGELLVGSGQTYGGFEVIVPFQHLSTDDVNGRDPMSSLFQPELSSGESITVVHMGGDDGWDLHVGTSYGRVLRYGLNDYSVEKTISKSSSGFLTDPLDVPPSFVISPPALTIDPTILCSNHPSSSLETGIYGWNVFDSYVMGSDPKLSYDGAMFHPRYPQVKVRASVAHQKAMIHPPKRLLSSMLRTKLEESPEGVFPTSSLDMKNNILTTPTMLDDGDSKTILSNTLPNPNKIIYSTEVFATCYDVTVMNQLRKVQDNNNQPSDDKTSSNEVQDDIPLRYRLMVRPPFYKVANFDYSLYNESGIWVGWDYASTFSNSFACSVLALLYFVTEIRTTALQLQLCGNELALPSGKHERRGTNVSILAELGLLFHQIESLSANGMIQTEIQRKKLRSKLGQVKAFVPSNFISSFMLLPEATNLALIDGVPGAAETARRPEAFYRFLMQYIDRELEQLWSTTTVRESSENAHEGHLIDSLQGIGFLSVIEYATGKPTISRQRALTVDLAYDQKWQQRLDKNSDVRFGEVLRHTLCKEAPLRAWCEETRSYEAVVQRKFATNLPSLLSLSCSCAGSNVRLGLQIWQQKNIRNWLPEHIEVQIESDKSITVKELVVNDDGEDEWLTVEGKLTLSESLFDGQEMHHHDLPIKKSYRLDAVVSFIRSTNLSTSIDASQVEGHHVVHVRTSIEHERRMLNNQLRQIEKYLDNVSAVGNTQIHMSESSLTENLQHIKNRIAALEEKETGDQWWLLNGFVLTKIENADDIRSFSSIKEPCIVIFREIDSKNCSKGNVIVQPRGACRNSLPMVPVSTIRTVSLSKSSRQMVSDLGWLPSKGDLVAIDAEFVCVQQEQSLMLSSGSKEITSEARNALARLSIINCQTNEIIIDDYILPMEPVVDYLTRFSGIRPNDLDVNTSPHHLVSPHEAYLKVRLLMERGCIFVGHGLSQDFRMINICIPPNQIIDTAEIYHQPNQRYISLRYLTNFVLNRDMQQEVHDSIEDARAAHELYNKSLNLKQEGKFNEYIVELYARGHLTQFKLGITSK